MASILITGASQGIGMATALVLGRAGHRVYATMRNPSRAPELGQIAIQEALPITVSTMDVDSDNSVTEAIRAIHKEQEAIEVLVNNAVIERRGSTEELDLSDFRAVMETNYFGPLRTIRAWLPEMRERRSGCIINVTSVAGKIACSPLTPYAASKFALEALSEGLAQEVKPFNIRVAVVEPGIIDTPMARNIEHVPTDAEYPQVRRFGHMFEASLDHPTPPTIVAEKIREIIESGTFKLRHPVGPDAEAFLGWRASLNDEEWVEWGALADEAWYERVAKDFGLDARAKRTAATDVPASPIGASA